MPIKLDDYLAKTNKAWVEKILEDRHIGDFRNWKNYRTYKESFERLVKSIEAEEAVLA